MPAPITTSVVRHTSWLDRPAKGLQSIVNGFWRRLRPLQSLVNGTWLGHAIHPILTDVVIGAWTIVLLFDLIGFAMPSAGLGSAAEIALWFGVLSAAGAIVTGLTDWKDAYGDELRLGFLHLLIMVTVTILYVASGLVRFSGPVDSTPARIVAIVAYVLVSAGGYFGGEIAMAFGSMVDHNAFTEGLGQFAKAGPLAAMKEGLNFVVVEGRPVLLVRRGDGIDAIGAVCSHAGGPLQKGRLLGDEVECPWHGSRFCLADGSVRRGPATYPQPAFEVRVSDGQVEVRSRA